MKIVLIIQGVLKKSSISRKIAYLAPHIKHIDYNRHLAETLLLTAPLNETRPCLQMCSIDSVAFHHEHLKVCLAVFEVSIVLPIFHGSAEHVAHI